MFGRARSTHTAGGAMGTRAELLPEKRGLRLDRFVLLGRTFEVYRRYFLLEPETLVGKSVLDVAGGVSSFCAEANKLGINVTSFDPIYSLPPERIMERSEPDLIGLPDYWICADLSLGLLQKSRIHARITQTRVHHLSVGLQDSSGTLCSRRATEGYRSRIVSLI
jgi:hypothetical protein